MAAAECLDGLRLNFALQAGILRLLSRVADAALDGARAGPGMLVVGLQEWGATPGARPR